MWPSADDYTTHYSASCEKEPLNDWSQWIQLLKTFVNFNQNLNQMFQSLQKDPFHSVTLLDVSRTCWQNAWAQTHMFGMLTTSGNTCTCVCETHFWALLVFCNIEQQLRLEGNDQALDWSLSLWLITLWQMNYCFLFLCWARKTLEHLWWHSRAHFCKTTVSNSRF